LRGFADGLMGFFGLSGLSSGEFAMPGNMGRQSCGEKGEVSRRRLITRCRIGSSWGRQQLGGEAALCQEAL
jgi:hypothetical protein